MQHAEILQALDHILDDGRQTSSDAVVQSQSMATMRGALNSPSMRLHARQEFVEKLRECFTVVGRFLIDSGAFHDAATVEKIQLKISAFIDARVQAHARAFFGNPASDRRAQIECVEELPKLKAALNSFANNALHQARSGLAAYATHKADSSKKYIVSATASSVIIGDHNDSSYASSFVNAVDAKAQLLELLAELQGRFSSGPTADPDALDAVVEATDLVAANNKDPTRWRSAKGWLLSRLEKLADEGATETGKKIAALIVAYCGR